MLRAVDRSDEVDGSRCAGFNGSASRSLLILVRREFGDHPLDVSALVGAIVWPLVLVILVVIYHAPIVAALGTARERGFKLGLPGGWSFELPGATEARVNWVSGRMGTDLRRPVSYTTITDSTRAEFSAQLRDRTPAQYALVDLGGGQEWLSSRLYIMSILLARLRSVDALVFLEERGAQSGCFTGWAFVNEVRWALARASPRLEPAFAQAEYKLYEQSQCVVVKGGVLAPPDQPTTPGSLSPEQEAPVDLLSAYLQQIQLPVAPPNEKSRWQPLVSASGIPAPLMVEYGQWLDRTSIRELLGDHLQKSSIRENELLSKPEAEQVRLIVSHHGNYVALTDDDGRLTRLIDRGTLIEQLSSAASR